MRLGTDRLSQELRSEAGGVHPESDVVACFDDWIRLDSEVDVHLCGGVHSELSGE